MKKIILIIALLILRLSATEQEPDFIKYEGKINELMTNYLSPLQLYFISSGEKYPFKSSGGTGNYRGHVATWELEKGLLYLIKVEGGESCYIEETDINRLFSKEKSQPNKIKAEWFSGIFWVKTGKHKVKYHNGEEHPWEEYYTSFKNYVFLRFDKGKLSKKIVLTKKDYMIKMADFSKRKGTENPVTSGPIYEYSQYISSLRKKEEEHLKVEQKKLNK